MSIHALPYYYCYVTSESGKYFFQEIRDQAQRTRVGSLIIDGPEVVIVGCRIGKGVPGSPEYVHLPIGASGGHLLFERQHQRRLDQRIVVTMQTQHFRLDPFCRQVRGSEQTVYADGPLNVSTRARQLQGRHATETEAHGRHLQGVRLRQRSRHLQCGLHASAQQCPILDIGHHERGIALLVAVAPEHALAIEIQGEAAVTKLRNPFSHAAGILATTAPVVRHQDQWARFCRTVIPRQIAFECRVAILIIDVVCLHVRLLRTRNQSCSSTFSAALSTTPPAGSMPSHVTTPSSTIMA